MGLEGFFVEHLDSRQTVLEVFRVIFFLPETYCCVFADVFKAFEAAVDADGAELFVDVDKSCGVGGGAYHCQSFAGGTHGEPRGTFGLA